MLEKAGKNSGDNRRDNRGLVLRMVATGACRTRRDLVVRTGLSKMTISNFILDAWFDGIGNFLEKEIKSITGVIESGLFIGYDIQVLAS